ncbi:MAG: RteC domain-containing protein [Flavobacteriia bacterium]|nr:RteC domain-containing protein [Flavobacteriia bacterium]
MKVCFAELFNEMENRINSLSKENHIESYSYKIQIVENVLDKLKLILNDKKFQSDSDEINYFKNLKPTIIARLVIYKRLQQIEFEKPHGSVDKKIAHLVCELNRLTRYSKANSVFVQYIRSGRTHLDSEYFLRKNAKINQMYETFASEIDYTTGTGFDYRLAVLMAHEQIENHVQEQIDSLKNPSHKNNFEFHSQYDTTCGINQLNWTISQADLVELIYGLYSMKAFNHGRTEIREIAEFLEEKFNVKLNNVYRSFSDIKNRKSVDRFKFITQMLEQLENISDEIFITNDKN